MKKLTIVSLIFLSVQLFSQTQSLAYRIPFSGNSQIQTDSLSSEKKTNPRLSIMQILGQELVGTGVGIVAAVIVGTLGNSLAVDKEFSKEEVLGALIGYSLGNALGIYWIGNTAKFQGSFGYTLLGSFVGMAAGAYLTMQTKSAIPIFILPGVGGIIAFYLSSEEVVPECSEAFIQIQNEKVHFGNPKIFLTRIDETSNKLRYNFELLRVNF